jgi:hypothetical protein
VLPLRDGVALKNRFRVAIGIETRPVGAQERSGQCGFEPL